MLRSLAKLALLALLVIGGSVGIVYYRDHTDASRQISKLEQDKKQLQQVVQRLTSDRRVADVLVIDRPTTGGISQTTLLLVEYAADGSPLPPKYFTIRGNVAHIDALVIKFERDLIARDDPLRGHSIALFTRLYGEDQAPADAYPIDPPGKIPDYYRGADPHTSSFEQDLWANFWKLAEDPAYAKSRGVRVANGQGVWGPFDFGKLYTLTLESDGGINITPSPVTGIYAELLKQRHAARVGT